MDAAEEFLADVKQEGSDPFADLEKETPSDSPAEKEPEAVKPEEGANTPDENVPFHKHPRWIERENELKTLRETEEEHAREIAELRSFNEEVAQKLEPTDTSVPDWFRELYGDNTVAWQKYHAREIATREEIRDAVKREIADEQVAAQKQQVEETTRWNKWVDDEIGKLQSEGNTFDRNKLIKTMLDFRPTDESNNLDFHAGLKIYQALEEKTNDAEKSQARKELADTATKVSRGDPPKKDYMTPADLRYRSWGSL